MLASVTRVMEGLPHIQQLQAKPAPTPSQYLRKQALPGTTILPHLQSLAAGIKDQLLALMKTQIKVVK